MTNKLIVNPYLRVESQTENAPVIFLSAPKPDKRLQRVQISRSEQENIFQVFTDLSKTRFDFLDAEKDLSEKEREMLLQYGILVEPDEAPDKPLFACPLEEVEPRQNDSDILIVNPTFRFEAFNLANFASWTQEKHLSPYKPSAWIKRAVTGIEIGYWLSAEEAELVSRFVAGENPDLRDDEELVQRLSAAEILVAPEHIQKEKQTTNQILEEAKEKLNRDKYAVLRDLLPPEQMAAMRRFYRQYVEQGFMPLGDGQVKERFRQHNEPIASALHKQFTALMNLVVGAELKPSYVYAASYKEGAELQPHTDREQCEYSISFQVDYQPCQPDDISPWALYVEPLDWSGDLTELGVTFDWNEKFREENTDAKTAVYLASGDGLIYKGRELVHYRFALPAGHKSTSLFFHYVDAGFAGNLR